MATHTNDCFDCDFRVALVKGKLHAPGEKRPVAPARFQYPRYSMLYTYYYTYIHLIAMMLT